MTIQSFFKKYKWVVNTSRIERNAGVPVNTISHSTSSEKRKIDSVNQGKVTKYLKRLHYDLGKYLEPEIFENNE